MEKKIGENKIGETKKDEYSGGLAVRNGWRCRFCGRYPEPGQSFGSEGVCPACRERVPGSRS